MIIHIIHVYIYIVYIYIYYVILFIGHRGRVQPASNGIIGPFLLRTDINEGPAAQDLRVGRFLNSMANRVFIGESSPNIPKWP